MILFALDGDRFWNSCRRCLRQRVSAAFYMAEVKGIFQALSRVAASPRDLLLRANQALADQP